MTQHSAFGDAAILSGLVTQEQLAQAAQSISDSNIAIDTELTDSRELEAMDEDRRLADCLVAASILTRYQADQILNGRTKFNLGPYVITDWIGQGGMGQVFKAIHAHLGRESAVKVLPLSRATPESISNFMREVRTQAQLDHHNLVRAYDAGVDGQVHYLVTEYVPGADLRKLVRSQGTLTVQQGASVIMQAAMALDYAHKRGLIHRDVKPGNILVTPDGVAKVSDLGLAGFIHEASHDPRSGKIVGTPDYLAPEQVRSGEATCASDIYSLGCTLYYAVCGKVPFPGGTAKDKVRRHLQDTPWHPRRFKPDISEEFVEIIADMMEKSPMDRTQSAAEVVARLEPYAVEGSLIPSQFLNRSRWSAPPPPASKEELEEQYLESEEYSAPGSGSQSQISMGTQKLASSLQETIATRGKVVNPASPAGDSVLNYVLLTIAITAPISMIIGGMIALFATRFM